MSPKIACTPVSYTHLDVYKRQVFGLSFGLPAFALVKTVLPAFYARQDTKTPVRAGLVAMVANMLFNVGMLALLYQLWVPESAKTGGVMETLANVPGLHFALGVALSLIHI